ncbi:MAG: coproporphyrinogen III oxidase [Alphaproteobacteria bacterium]|nr:coproporphyrinogen III oxidase [Alphaproteobacteria bacterium]
MKQNHFKEKFGIYIHWPFCISKCPYCDFNSHVREAINNQRWQNALLAEMRYFVSCTQGRTVESIFFGGGTPSLMEPKTVATLIHQASQYWNFSPNLEITLEANPNSVDTQRFQNFKSAGINRVSIGIQSLDNQALRFLGRKHSREEAIKAIRTAASIFERFSFDLIYSRPNQSVESWRKELTEALSYSRDHLSLYQLTIEPGTAFHTLHQRKEFELPDQDLGADLYEITQEMLENAGMPSYEISNHARLGYECRHNMLYWRYQDYIGIGPGAHGRLSVNGQKIATRCLKAPENWLETVEKTGHGIHEEVILKDEDKINEMLMMGLRLVEGISMDNFQAQTGFNLLKIVNQQQLKRLIDGDFLIISEDFLKATPRGRQCLNSVLSALL